MFLQLFFSFLFFFFTRSVSINSPLLVMAEPLELGKVSDVERVGRRKGKWTLMWGRVTYSLKKQTLKRR